MTYRDLCHAHLAGSPHCQSLTPDAPLPSPKGCALMHLDPGIRPTRVFAMSALALSLAGCNGDRIKDNNLQPPSTAQLVLTD